MTSFSVAVAPAQPPTIQATQVYFCPTSLYPVCKSLMTLSPQYQVILWNQPSAFFQNWTIQPIGTIGMVQIILTASVTSPNSVPVGLVLASPIPQGGTSQPINVMADTREIVSWYMSSSNGATLFYTLDSNCNKYYLSFDPANAISSSLFITSDARSASISLRNAPALTPPVAPLPAPAPPLISCTPKYLAAMDAPN